MRVLVTVSIDSLRLPSDLRVLDGSSLTAHLRVARGIFDLRSVSSTQQELGASCVAEVLLQLILRHMEVRAWLVRCHRALLACKVAALCWTGSSVKPALQHKLPRSALQTRQSGKCITTKNR